MDMDSGPYETVRKALENQAENWYWNLVPRPISTLCSPVKWCPFKVGIDPIFFVHCPLTPESLVWTLKVSVVSSNSDICSASVNFVWYDHLLNQVLLYQNVWKISAMYLYLSISLSLYIYINSYSYQQPALSPKDNTFKPSQAFLLFH